MSDLVVSINEMPDSDGSVVRVTPESAGWAYVGFEVLRPRLDGPSAAHERRRGLPGPSRGLLQRLSAKDYEWRVIDGRDTVFERPPYAVYLPPGTDYTVEADSYLYWQSVRRRRRVASSLSWYVPKR